MPKEQEPAQVLKRFRKEGWTLYTGKGSHVVVRKDGIQISVPTSKKEIPIGTYRKIARLPVGSRPEPVRNDLNEDLCLPSNSHSRFRRRI